MGVCPPMSDKCSAEPKGFINDKLDTLLTQLKELEGERRPRLERGAAVLDQKRQEGAHGHAQGLGSAEEYLPDHSVNVSV